MDRSITDLQESFNYNHINNSYSTDNYSKKCALNNENLLRYDGWCYANVLKGADNACSIRKINDIYMEVINDNRS